MSTQFTAVININLRLQKQNAENSTERNTKHISSLWLNITGICCLWDNQATPHVKNHFWITLDWKLWGYLASFRLIRTDLFLGRSSDCTIMSSRRDEKMYNALYLPFYPKDERRASFCGTSKWWSWICASGCLSLCVVWAFVCMCTLVDVWALACMKSFVQLCTEKEASGLPLWEISPCETRDNRKKGRDTK